MELSISLRKLISSLDSAKHRREHGLFIAKGHKCVVDTLNHFETVYLAATHEWLSANQSILPNGVDPMQVSSRDLKRLSDFGSAPDVVAVYRIPDRQLDTDSLKGQLIIALDNVQDPGNLGTIMRTADWFGIDTILCSRSTVDCYSPKVVQATMGAISRVAVYYCDLAATLRQLKHEMPVYGTFLDGNNIYTETLSPVGVIVMGNEGRGVSSEVAAEISHKLLIPSYPAGVATSESLNVGVATAITVSEFRRSQIIKS